MNFNRSTKNILPPRVQIFLKHRLLELGGCVVFLVGVFVFLALITYHQQDPSWNTLATASPKNFCGFAGAYLADFSFQTIGFTSYALSFVLLSWGVSFVIKKELPLLKIRLFLFPLSLVFLAMGLSPLVFPTDLWVSTTPGGVFGFVLYNQFIELMNHLHVPIPDILWSLIFLLCGVGLALFVCGIPLHVWERIGHWALIKIKDLGSFLFSVLQKWYIQRQEKRLHGLSLFKDADTLSLALPSHQEQPQERPNVPQKAPAQRAPSKKPLSSPMPRSADGYAFPPFHLLREVDHNAEQTVVHQKEMKESAEALKSVLDDFGVEGEITKVRPGPVVTLYELTPAPGIKSSRVIGLSDDIARSMSSISARIAVVPGYNVIGIELPNENRKTVYLRSLLEDQNYQNSDAHLPLALGRNIGGDPVVSDLARMPHLLVAGTTGSGKSVAINTMILSLLYRLTPEQCRFIMIDPKMLELSIYDGIPHLLTPVVTDPHKAVMALKWAVREMESRYQAMSKIGVRNIDGYNKRILEALAKGETLSRSVQTGFDPETGKPIYENQAIPLKSLPYIVVIVDEMADLMLVAGKDIEGAVQRLAQMARAAGIHLIMATQRPSVDVITGTIKANFPTRISFNVTSKIDSRTILGEMGAEQLLGQGDMLFMAPGGRITRVHGPFVSDDEVERITTFLKSQGNPDYETSVTEEQDSGLFGDEGDGEGSGDILYDQALQLIMNERKASTSFIQRHLQIGYNRAARIMDRLESEGVVSAANHVGKREVLIKG
jgi:S-DNA-T family DNA segregation ATPase FtsK/SpoIIIE